MPVRRNISKILLGSSSTVTSKGAWPERKTPEQRRAIMRAVKQSNTAPELKVRKRAHRLGLRFRLHVNSLPGKPDLVFPKWKICLFVHGCFWHRHPGCRKSSTPETNTDLWAEKFKKTVVRDRRVTEALESLGWRVEVIWECETSQAALTEKLESIFPLKTQPNLGRRGRS